MQDISEGRPIFHREYALLTAEMLHFALVNDWHVRGASVTVRAFLGRQPEPQNNSAAMSTVLSSTPFSMRTLHQLGSQK